jgi:hypothetical protein
MEVAEASEAGRSVPRGRLLFGFLLMGSVAALEALHAWIVGPLLVTETESALPGVLNALLALTAFVGPVFAPGAPRRWGLGVACIGPFWVALNMAAGGTIAALFVLVLTIPLVILPLLRLARAQEAATREPDAALRLRTLRRGTEAWLVTFLACTVPPALAVYCVPVYVTLSMLELPGSGTALAFVFGRFWLNVEAAFEKAWNSPSGDLRAFLVPGTPSPPTDWPRAPILDRLELRIDDSVETTKVYVFRLADGSEVLATFEQTDGSWSGTWTTRERSLLSAYREFQEALARDDREALLALVPADRHAAIAAVDSWRIGLATSRVFSRDPWSATPLLSHHFERDGVVCWIWSRWEDTPEGWKLLELIVEP